MVESVSMRILGIDPGIARVGWAIIERNQSVITTRSYGCITTNQSDEESIRLLIISKQTTLLIRQHKPDCIALEKLFFATNAKTVIGVGQARGVILLVGASYSLPIFSYTPLEVKRAITGDGHADKLQVGRMVQMTLKLSELPKPDDTADALAIALTHAYSYKMKGKRI